MRKLTIFILAALGLSSCIVLDAITTAPVVDRVGNCQTCSGGTGGCSIHSGVNVPAEIGSYDPKELGFIQVDSTQN